jgi:hypothetical protein
MSSIRLAGNLIATSEGWANWGHLQIVNASTGKELEVQSWINRQQNDPFEFPDFLYRREQDHSSNTDFAPGSGNANPDNYASTAVSLGESEEADVWAILVKANNDLCRSKSELSLRTWSKQQLICCHSTLDGRR